MLEMDKDGNWQTYKDNWMEGPSSALSTLPETRNKYTPDVWSMWSKDFVHRISNSRRVESVIALGSVLAISLHDIQAGTFSNPILIKCLLISYLLTSPGAIFARLTDSRLQFVSREWASKSLSRRVHRVQGPLSGPRECVLPDG